MRKLFLLAATAAALGLGLEASFAQQQDYQDQSDQAQRDQQTTEQQRQQQQQREQQQREQQQRERQQQEQREQERQRQQQQQQQRQRFGSEQEDQQARDQGEFGGQQQFRDQQQYRDQQFPDQQFRGERFQTDRSRRQLDLGARFQESGDRLVVSNVTDQSLASQVGLRQNDVIMSVDGRAVRTQNEFERIIFSADAQQGRIPVVITRDGQRQTVYLDANQIWQDDRRFARQQDYYAEEQGAWLGVILDPRYEDYAVVRRVFPGSAADNARVQEGDWIVGVNNQRVRSPAHLSQLIENMRPGQQIDLQVARRVTRSLSATLGDASDRFREGRFAERPGAFEQDRIFRDEEVRTGYRGFEDDQDAFEDEVQPQQQRGILRDRFGTGERGLRDRLDRDQQQDEQRRFNLNPRDRDQD